MGIMIKRRGYKKPSRKATIEEFCTTKYYGDTEHHKWCSEEEYITTICQLIEIGIFDLDDMKAILVYNDYCKIRRAWNQYNEK